MFTLHNGTELVKFLIRDGLNWTAAARLKWAGLTYLEGLTEKSRTAKIINGFTLAQHICVLSATDSGQILLSIFSEKYVGSKKFSTLIIKVDFCKRVQNIIIVYFYLRKRCYDSFPGFPFFGHLELSLNWTELKFSKVVYILEGFGTIWNILKIGGKIWIWI